METTPDHRPALRSWALLLLIAACDRKPEPPPAPAVAEAGSPPGASLLQLTPSRLALEWQFESPSSTPPSPFRGWEGKWLAVRIPRDAHVAAIKLNAGASESRVAVFRDGAKLKEATLQREALIPIDGPGGELRIEALGGSLHVRDFDVLGQPGTERQSIARLPVARFGSLDAGENVSGPWPKLLAYCEKQGGGSCAKAVGSLGSAGAIFGVTTTNGDVAIETKRGWFVLPAVKRVDRGTIKVERPEAGTPFVSFEHDDRSDDVPGVRLDGPVGKTFVEATRRLVVCRIVDDWVDCDERHDLATWHGEVPVSLDRGVDAGPLRYADAAAPRVLPDGGIVVP